MAVTLEELQAMAEKAGLPKPGDEIREALVDRGPPVFVRPGEECQVRVEVLQNALGDAIHAGMEPKCLRRLSWLVLDQKKMLGRALTRDPTADMDPPRVVVIKPEVWLVWDSLTIFVSFVFIEGHRDFPSP